MVNQSSLKDPNVAKVLALREMLIFTKVYFPTDGFVFEDRQNLFYALDSSSCDFLFLGLIVSNCNALLEFMLDFKVR